MVLDGIAVSSGSLECTALTYPDCAAALGVGDVAAEADVLTVRTSTAPHQIIALRGAFSLIVGNIREG
jgi:hypothetical protein